MQRLSTEALDRLLVGASLLAGTEEKPRIMTLADGQLLKFFYKRRGWSSSHIWPHAKRFRRNAKRLSARQVLAPQVSAVFACPERRCHILIYEALVGEDVRQRVSQGDVNCLQHLPVWLAELHRKGVFFRGIHLGNVLASTTARFALLDIADMRFKHRPIGLRQRARNIAHLFKNRDDHATLQRFGLNRFMTIYLAATALSVRRQQRLSQLVAKKLGVSHGSAD